MPGTWEGEEGCGAVWQARVHYPIIHLEFLVISNTCLHPMQYGINLQRVFTVCLEEIDIADGGVIKQLLTKLELIFVNCPVLLSYSKSIVI